MSLSLLLDPNPKPWANVNCNNITSTGTISGGGVVSTLAPVGAVPNANGAIISGNTLTLEPADGTNPGLLTTSAQIIGGAKTFNAGIVLGSTPTTLDFYEELLVNSISWFNTIVASSNVRLVRIGKIVTADFAGVNAITSAAATIQSNVNSIPLRFQPAVSQNSAVLVDNNATPGVPQLGIFTAVNNGSFVVSGTSTTANFTAGGTSGFHAFTMSWTTA